MKKIIKLIFTIPRFKLRFILFVIFILISQGVAIQILPFVDREVLTILQQVENEQMIDFRSLIPLVGIAVFTISVYGLFSRLSFSMANLLREDVWKKIFMEGFNKLLYHDLEYLISDRSGGLLNKLSRASDKLASLFTDSASALFRNFAKAIH